LRGGAGRRLKAMPSRRLPHSSLVQAAGAGVEQGRRKINQSLLRSTPTLDPSLPADNSPLSSGEMRGQFARLVEGANGKAEMLKAEN